MSSDYYDFIGQFGVTFANWLQEHDKKVILEFLEKVEEKWTMSKEYKSTANFQMIRDELEDEEE